MTRSFEDTLPAVAPVDEKARDRAARRQESLTKPPGALGRLEALAVDVAGIMTLQPVTQCLATPAGEGFPGPRSVPDPDDRARAQVHPPAQGRVAQGPVLGDGDEADDLRGGDPVQGGQLARGDGRRAGDPPERLQDPDLVGLVDRLRRVGFVSI